MKTIKYLNGIFASLLILIVISCQEKQAKEELTKFKQAESLKASNIELAKTFYKFLDVSQLDSLRACFNPDAKIFYESGDPITFNDIEPLIKTFYTSFPDYRHNILDIFAADDKVVVRLSYSATFTKKFLELNPNGVKFKYNGIQIFQFTNKKISNFWAVEDELGMMTQIGMELQPKK